MIFLPSDKAGKIRIIYRFLFDFYSTLSNSGEILSGVALKKVRLNLQ